MEQPLVSILIPTKDCLPMLLRCIEDHLAGRSHPLDAVWAEDALGAGGAA